VKSNLKKKFEMTDLGYFHYFLRLQVLQTKEDISLSQSRYGCDLFLFQMEDSKLAPSSFHIEVQLAPICIDSAFDDTLYYHLIAIL
jgi:hypothetical protein